MPPATRDWHFLWAGGESGYALEGVRDMGSGVKDPIITAYLSVRQCA